MVKIYKALQKGFVIITQRLSLLFWIPEVRKKSQFDERMKKTEEKLEMLVSIGMESYGRATKDISIEKKKKSLPHFLALFLSVCVNVYNMFWNNEETQQNRTKWEHDSEEELKEMHRPKKTK